MANPRRADYATQYEQWQQRFQKGKGGTRSWSEAQQEAQNNAFAALENGVSEVIIKHADNLLIQKETLLKI